MAATLRARCDHGDVRVRRALQALAVVIAAVGLIFVRPGLAATPQQYPVDLKSNGFFYNGHALGTLKVRPNDVIYWTNQTQQIYEIKVSGSTFDATVPPGQ